LLEQSGRLALQKRWESPALVSPLTPVVVNGVVFALSSGELRTGDVARTVKGSRRAVLYALDGATGNQLWNSGDTITGFVHSGALAAGGTRVYLATYDGTQYAFGFPIERLE
jgi:outer membrane protein assembly factor BamB